MREREGGGSRERGKVVERQRRVERVRGRQSESR